MSILEIVCQGIAGYLKWIKILCEKSDVKPMSTESDRVKWTNYLNFSFIIAKRMINPPNKAIFFLFMRCVF